MDVRRSLSGREQWVSDYAVTEHVPGALQQDGSCCDRQHATKPSQNRLQEGFISKPIICIECQISEQSPPWSLKMLC